MATLQSPTQPVTDELSALAALDKILASEPFRRSQRMAQFLKFVVLQTLKGDSESLKEVCVGRSVFGRDPAYDPQLDPIVRVEARRLRAKLEEYYSSEGGEDLILIQLPKGGYKPVFVDRSGAVGVSEPRAEDSLLISAEPLTAPARDASPSAKAPAARTLRWVLYPACALVLSVFIFFVWRHFQQGPALRYSPIPVSITSYFGEEFDPALSPDGSHFAFVRNGHDGEYNVYVRLISGGDALQLTHQTGENLDPAWSPDGRDIAFLRMTPGRTRVFVEPAIGGPERQITEVHSQTIIWKANATQLRGSLGPAWSPDGRYLAISEETESSSSNGIALVPLGFGAKLKLTHPPDGELDMDAAFSPDGRDIAFVRQSSNSSADVFIASIRDGHTRQITFDQHDIRGICWGPDGHSIIFSSNREGAAYALWSVSSTGGMPSLLSASGTLPSQPSTILGNKLLLYTNASENTNIWQIKGESSSAPELLISSSGHNNSPRYSPDGNSIVFVSDRSGNWELWLSDSQGRNPRQLTHFGGPMVGSPRWSPDGSQIAFDARPYGHSAIFVIRSAGGTPQLLMQNQWEERMPNWSLDGKSILFNSDRSGSVRLWRVTNKGREPVRLTDLTAYDSFESPDAKWIYFRSSGPGIWRVPAFGGKAEHVPLVNTSPGTRNFDLEGGLLYFASVDRESPRVESFDLTTGKLQTVAALPHLLVEDAPSLTVSRDGRSLLVAEFDHSGSDIYGLYKK
jgi:Tol biopolymer transport system component